MAHAETCPICYGNGILRYINGVEIRGIKLNGESEKQCHGCSGTGWIEVADSIPAGSCLNTVEMFYG